MATTSIDIASALGVGSGINTTTLVSELVAAARSPKETIIDNNTTTNNARISALASAKSSLSTFSTALTGLLTSTDYQGTPVSNNTTIATVTAMTGGTPSGLPAQLQVSQLAQAQVVQSTALSASTAVAGTGTLTFTTGSTSFDVTVDSSNNTLDGLAAAINAKNGGITASIVTDKSGARLVLKGATGADNSFTVTAGTDADADLQRFAYSGTDSTTMSKSQSALNSKITLDNVSMEFDSNTVTTAIPYLRIDLNQASPGTTVTLATDQPTSSMASLVQDYVQAYNNLKTALNTATAAPTVTTSSTSSTSTTSGTDGSNGSGLLSGDQGVRDMSNKLATLVSTQLATTGKYQTLADLGVSTNRDGTLSVDLDTLNAAIADDPAGVTQMLNPTTQDATHIGIAGALNTVTTYLDADDGPLAASAAIYDNMKTNLSNQLDSLNTQMTDYQTQLTATYTAMQTALTSLKATQSYLTQQIATWTSSSSSS